MGKFKYKKEDSKLFEDVVFLIEANDNERHLLWERFHHLKNDPNIVDSYISSWEQEFQGLGLTIGKIDDRPITIAISWAKLNGKRVMFYYGCSQLVDYKMIEDWLKHFTLKTIRWDNGSRWAHCDAMNFHLCISALREKFKNKC